MKKKKKAGKTRTTRPRSAVKDLTATKARAVKGGDTKATTTTSTGRPGFGDLTIQKVVDKSSAVLF